LPFGVKSFEGTDIYTPDDMPQIDFLLISHDHYDHLDYKTIVALKPKVKNVICGLGVGEHFEYWEYEPSLIIEKDWYETVSIDESIKIHILPARHGSGRSIARDNTLWVSFIIETPLEKIYLGGDSGYDTHFAEIGAKYGSIDIAILENGQYNDAWHYIHTLPDEVLQAAKDLNAKRIFPVHSSKFFMARHSWDEPLVKLSELCEEVDFPLITPMIGEAVFLNDSTRIFRKWWLGLN
ncbi:MAG: MBL fold metallo-hydrolase, partial [Bacteroidales bacterium]|jgi:L-ascorbate metabolism protein UlaG (beta-lactamase superfamily)|nr:MBL fold metallo-hydrolase [Bacteroidales bacterium]